MRTTHLAVVVLATLLVAPSLADEIIYFTNGRTMPVLSHTAADGMVQVTLPDGGVLAFPDNMVEKIEVAGQSVAKDNAVQANRAVAGKRDAGDTTMTASRPRRQEVPNPSTQPSQVEIDKKTGMAQVRPMGNSAAANKRKLAVTGTIGSFQGQQATRGGNGSYLGATPRGQRHVIGPTAAPRMSRKASGGSQVISLGRHNTSYQETGAEGQQPAEPAQPAQQQERPSDGSQAKSDDN